ncbi:transcriptional regulator DEF1 [Acyrthosiphon pisum]|uniref:Protein CASC3 n=1 Tax=Acyrthosiphon pisum TaxID=7029 RepID=A0A8R2A7H5_ACYPI|nr:transcriptional regulator DEF1 [Acyrthosiphon pisum]|eukprot:XP_001952339.1 PREDICTED: transcriptional regulator DEF1 [Acyrthosiphon pisum]
MESTAVNVKEEDTVAKVAVATIAASDAANSIAVTDEIVPPIKLDKEIIMTTDNVEHVVVSEQADVSNETAITVNATSNKEDQLNIAMASTTISTNEVDEIKHNLGDTVLDKQQKPATATVEKDIVINETSDINLDISLKTKSESDEIYNSTMGSVFEDAVEYIINDEEDNVQEQPQDVIQEENVPDDESGSQQEVEGGDGEEDYDEETKDPAAPAEPVVPVPVDDDTNDPQYIPRRGRFYEHDDRMAYSTTSSEGSESDNGYEEDSGDDDGVSDRRRVRRRHTSIKKQKSVTPVDTAENTALAVVDGSLSTKKVLAISKVAATTKDSETAVTADGLAKKLSVGSRKSRDLDALDRWTHDLYDENEQTRKSRDELLASYGYDIREESEAPRARRHHKYGRAATTKYTRSWQDTKAYIGAAGGQQSMKVKRGGMARRNVGGLNKNINKSTTDEYTSEFPALDDTKKSVPNTSTLPSTESSAVVEVSDQNHEQQLKSLSVQNEDKKSVAAVVETSQARHHTSSSRATPKYNTTSPTNRNNRQDQNGGPSSSSTNNKNYYNRSSTESPISKEKGAQVNRDSPSSAANSNFFNRRPQQNSSGHTQHHNYKQQHYNSSQHNQQHQNSSPSGPRSRNFHQHQTSQQYNRDRYFSKGATPSSSSSSNQHNYDQQHHSGVPTTAGTGRTQHGGGHYQHYNNRQYENENQPIDPPVPPTPVVRSSKRYSVQSRRELPDPVLNFGGLSKTPQPQPPAPQQQNGLVMQDQQMQPTPQQLQQQQPIQIHQQPPPLLPQYHQPLQQIHHGMVLDHNTGMMVMAAADPTMYHHQMYATPQYATGVAPGPAAGSADDQNAAAAAAAAALQMLAAQAAVYQPVPTGATGVTSPPSGTQSLQQPETFMTTYYQPQQQPQQQPPPRRVNLAIPIVAPPPEPNQQQGNLKTNLSTTPPPTTASAN